MKRKVLASLSTSIFVALICSFSNPVFAQDPIFNESTESTSYDPIVAALDSLVNQNFLQKAGESSAYSVNDDFQPKEVPVYDHDIYAKRIQKIPTPIPLCYNAQVKEYIDLYSIKRRALTSRMMGLAGLYFPLFEQVLDQQGLPLEFKYLAIVESALNPTAVSRMGATGLWQFMLATGKMYDLKVNSYVDERRDPIKATYAACRYFKDMYAIYNDWLLVIAAYNCGPGNVNKAIARSGGKKTFWEISPYLPAETRGYVPAFIAVTYLMNYTGEHNLAPVSPSISYFEADTVLIDHQVSLREVAEIIDVPVELLSYLNPVYKRGVIPDSDEPQVLRMPYGKINTYLANAGQFYKRQDEMNKSMLAAYTVSNSSESTATSAGTKKYHLVKRGEHLQAIANKYRVTVSDLKRWNKLRNNHLMAGQKLAVYVPVRSASSTSQNVSGSARKIAPATSEVKESNEGKDTSVRTVTSEEAAEKAKVVYHIVQAGDTLWAIAQRYEGVTVQQIKEVNRLQSNDLKVGTRLKVLLGS